MEIKKKLFGKILKLQNKKIKCPFCKKTSLEPFTPFCSKKCSDLDLIKWLSDEENFNLSS